MIRVNCLRPIPDAENKDAGFWQFDHPENMPFAGKAWPPGQQ